jgi:hypothetical protein
LALLFTGFVGLGSLLFLGLAVFDFFSSPQFDPQHLIALILGAFGLITLIPTALGVWLVWRTFTNRTGL